MVSSRVTLKKCLPNDARGKIKSMLYRKKKKDKKKFMPSYTEVNFLKKVLSTFDISAKTWEEWLSLWDGILYTGFSTDIIRDQKTRAEKLVDIIDKQNIRGEDVAITMMDGHGRQWISILIEFKKRGYDLKKVYLRLVDIDDAVNEWHELFFPPLLTEVIRSTPCEGGIYNELVPANGILYMNFCGLNGTNQKLLNRLTILKERGMLSRTMVSFSSRGGNNPRTYNFIKEIGNEVCSRGHRGMGFHTFAFD